MPGARTRVVVSLGQESAGPNPSYGVQEPGTFPFPSQSDRSPACACQTPRVRGSTPGPQGFLPRIPRSLWPVTDNPKAEACRLQPPGEVLCCGLLSPTCQGRGWRHRRDSLGASVRPEPPSSNGLCMCQGEGGTQGGEARSGDAVERGWK